MSRVLSLTSMMSELTTLKAATSTISVRIRNITFCSTWTAPKKLLLLCVQSTTRTGWSASSVRICAADTLHPLGVAHADLDLRGRPWLLEEHLGGGHRQEHEGAVVVVHTGLEDRHHRVGAHPRHGAERGGRTLGRDQRELRADVESEALGQRQADGDRVVAAEAVERAGADVVADGVQRAQVLGPGCRAPARRCSRRWSVSSTCPSTSGIADTTPGTSRMRASDRVVLRERRPGGVDRRDRRSGRVCLPSRSDLKPFMTDMTMMSVATPRAMPTRLKAAITETKRSPRRARR